MSNRVLHPFLQKLAALVILGVGLGALVGTIAFPLADAYGAHRTAEARLARFKEMLTPAASGVIAYNPGDLSASHRDDAEAQVALQGLVDRIARSAGVGVQSVRPMAAEYMGDIGRSVWLEVMITCDLQGLVDLLADFDVERPVLLLRRLDIERGDSGRPDQALRIRLEAGRVWRESEEQS